MCGGCPRKAAGERLAGDFQAVPRFLLAEPQPVSTSVRRALDVSPRGAGPAVVLIVRRWRGPGARHGLGAGRGAGGASRRRGGSAAGRPGAPGGRRRKRGRRCSQPLGRLEAVGVWLRFCRPFLARAARGTPSPPGSGGLRTFSPSRAGGPGRTPGPGAISGPRSPRGAAGRGRAPVRRLRRSKDGGAPCGRRLPTPGPWLRWRSGCSEHSGRALALQAEEHTR
ncbi:collagen alpha-2(I) chain-like [Manis pentadactyla]|uniref:collagen alpha-2(I) chain-like n=1 Tax=Manis pentadactyla TaxID=143292 RepID=UPI00255C44F1|nr:collagen alpha-2(I) chain-like [Manis pentadactyla]